MGDLHVSYCSIVALDSASLCYRVCWTCERVVPETNSHSHDSGVPHRHPCDRCRSRPRNPNTPTTKHLYRLLERVMVVVAFDRAAQALMGCSADEFVRFASSNTCAAEMAGEVLQGEMMSMVLRSPKGGHAQQLRAVSITPLSHSFQPVMATLSNLYAAAI